MTIEFTRPEFHASVAEVRASAGLLTQARARASGEVDTLLDSWRGAAAASFAEAWADWLTSSARVVRSLEGIADSLDAFHDDITTCDARSATSLDVLTGRLS